MVATSGAQLLPETAVKTLCESLLPMTNILTPNIPEANLILKVTGKAEVDVNNLDGLKKLATAVQSLGPQYVLLKGGHRPLTKEYNVAKMATEEQIVANILIGKDVMEVLEFPYVKTRNTHGTGCSLACKTVRR